MVAGLGGPGDFVADYERILPRAELTIPVYAETDGLVTVIDTFLLGNSIIELGGGRRRLGDELDLSVGLTAVAAAGEAVDSERPLALVHANSRDAANAAADTIRRAFEVTDGSAEPQPVIREYLGAD
jgi:thymidine phosphorylase